jgi:hypothetical protein
MRTLVCGALLALLGAAFLAVAGEKKDDDKGTALFNGTDLNGWKLLDPKATERSKWSVVGGLRLKPDLPGQFDFDKGTGILLNGGDGKGINLLSEAEHADCELHVEFNVSKGSNSGVYFMGRYEVQILDSFGKKDAELKYGDCGGIYNTAPPRTNVCKAPGEWQSFDVVFQAPRFEADGKKSANAKFVKVTHNGTVIHEDVEVKGTTTAGLDGPEKPRGPIMLQGDHGPVAFRNMLLRVGAGK